MAASGGDGDQAGTAAIEAAAEALVAKRRQLEDRGRPAARSTRRASTTTPPRTSATRPTPRTPASSSSSSATGTAALLREVMTALRKLDEGGFGECERCGEPIGEKRARRPAVRPLLHRVPAAPRARGQGRRRLSPARLGGPSMAPRRRPAGSIPSSISSFRPSARSARAARTIPPTGLLRPMLDGAADRRGGGLRRLRRALPGLAGRLP